MSEISSCSLCGNLVKLSDDCLLQKGKTNFIVVGESPAKNGWIVSKKAFFDANGKLQASGRVLQKLLDILNISITDIYFTEACKCIIEDRKNLEKCSQNCLPYLKKQLAKLPCKVILTMGLHPTQALLGTKIKKFSDFVGKEFNFEVDKKKFILIPIYHPSPLNPKGYSGNVEIFEKLKKYI